MKIFKKIIVVILLLFLTGCSEVKQYTSYTVYPIGYLLNRIAGNRIISVSVQNNSIIERAKPVDNIGDIIYDSYFFFHVGDLEPYLEMYNDDLVDSGVNKIDLSLLNAIYKFQRYTRVSSGDVETYIESPYYEGECFDNLDTYSFDLFLWLDPSGMLSMAKDVYDVMSNNFVEQSAFFKENYDKLYSELTTLEASYQQLSTKLKKENKVVKFVSMTPSFGAWQKSYGFSIYPICLSKYGTLPNDEQLEIIKQRIKNDNVKYIAYEPNMSEDMNNLFLSLQEELGLMRINLSNLSSLTNSQLNESKDYFSIMYENLSALESIAVSADNSNVIDDSSSIDEVAIDEEELEEVE